MLKRAARLAAGEFSEEAWYLMNLFQQSQPEEMLKICQHTLAKFLELNYDYFDCGWPLQSRMEAPVVQSSFCRSRFGRQKGEQKRLQAKSPPSRAAPTREPLTPVNIRDRSETPTPTPKKKPQLTRIGWLKGKSLLPSKPELSTPQGPGTPISKERPLSSKYPRKNSWMFMCPLPPAPRKSANPFIGVRSCINVVISTRGLILIQRIFHILVGIAVFGNPDASPDLSFPWDNSDQKRSQSRAQNSDFILCRYIIDFMLENPG